MVAPKGTSTEPQKKELPNRWSSRDRTPRDVTTGFGFGGGGITMRSRDAWPALPSASAVRAVMRVGPCSANVNVTWQPAPVTVAAVEADQTMRWHRPAEEDSLMSVGSAVTANGVSSYGPSPVTRATSGAELTTSTFSAADTVAEVPYRALSVTRCRPATVNVRGSVGTTKPLGRYMYSPSNITPETSDVTVRRTRGAEEWLISKAEARSSGTRRSASTVSSLIVITGASVEPGLAVSARQPEPRRLSKSRTERAPNVCST